MDPVAEGQAPVEGPALPLPWPGVAQDARGGSGVDQTAGIVNLTTVRWKLCLACSVRL